MSWLAVPVYVLGVLAVVATALPEWRTTRWWVRLCEFPRFQIALLAVGAIILVLIFSRPLGVADTVFAAILVAVAIWQFSWFWRYLPGAPCEAIGVEVDRGDPNVIRLLTCNVLQTTRDADGLLHIIRETDPDVILGVETDEWWCSTLSEGLSARYPHQFMCPLSNGYGLALFSRLELVDPEVRFVVDEAIPSIKTGVRLRSGAIIDLYGVHPRPPSILQDSTERDVELVRIGQEIKREQRPAVVLGDLNDVAWSPTTSEFKRVGGLLDPRCGRGFFNTYPAGMPGLRYPLDYVFHTRHFAIAGLRVLPRFASDHLPLCVSLRLQSESSSQVSRHQPEQSASRALA